MAGSRMKSMKRERWKFSGWLLKPSSSQAAGRPRLGEPLGINLRSGWGNHNYAPKQMQAPICHAMLLSLRFMNKDYFKRLMKRYIKLTLNLSIITTASKRGVFFSIHIFRKLTWRWRNVPDPGRLALASTIMIGTRRCREFIWGPRRLRSARFVQLGLGLGLTASLYLLLIGITS
jgi:hypothetical protein